MTAQSISAVVQQAVEWTGMEHVPVQDRTRHHGSGYLAQAFENYLRMLAVRHICCYSLPHHPQSNGKLERFHETLNARVNLLVYTGPDHLRARETPQKSGCGKFENSARIGRRFPRLRFLERRIWTAYHLASRPAPYQLGWLCGPSWGTLPAFLA